MPLMDAPVSPRPGSSGSRAPAWHSLEAEQCARLLAVDPGSGLAAADAANRLAEHGPNSLPEPEPPSLWRRVLVQFENPMQILLLGAGAASLAVGQVGTFVLLVLLATLNAVLGFRQAAEAEQSVRALQGMLSPSARTLRNGEVVEVEAAGLVPGDVVMLEAGDGVPADGRLLRTARLEVEESALTGESEPTSKDAGPSPEDSPVADRNGMVFMSTLVTRGSGAMLVTTTGAATQVGRIARMLETVEDDPSPLEQQMGSLTRTYGLIAGGALVVVVLAGLGRGLDFDSVLTLGSAVAIAAIPAALPTVMTALLSQGAQTLAAENAIVKDLNSVETLGSTTAICSDKTGTLTMNQMTASVLLAGGKSHQVSGRGYGSEGTIRHAAGDEVDLEPALTALALCSDATVSAEDKLVGDPTEGALVVLAEKGGLDVGATRDLVPRVAEVPFDSAYKLMATFHRVVDANGDEVIRCYAKGAPRAILDCAGSAWWDGEQPTPIDEARPGVEQANSDLASQGLRVLLFARRDFDPAEIDLEGDLLASLEDMQLLGMAGIVDPPRPEVRDAVDVAAAAGIRTRMITGDHPTTAGAIAEQLDIPGEAITGAELDALDDEELDGRLDAIGVVGRVAPEHKVRIVEALRNQDQVVAMTGDGVNDAPALRAADIGVAMGITGTEVSKQAARMVLVDDNFATIVRAVELGRAVFDNLLKSLRYMHITVAAYLAIFVLAAITGIAQGQPLTALQVLWTAFAVTLLPAVALAWDEPADDLMERPPRRPGQKLLDRSRFVRWSVAGAAIGIPALMLGALAPGGFPVGEPSTGNTLVLTTVSVGMLAATFGSRHATRSIFSRGMISWPILRSVLISGVLVVLVTELDFLRDWFGTVTLTGGQWAACLGVGVLVIVVQEIQKVFGRGV